MSIANILQYPAAWLRRGSSDIRIGFRPRFCAIRSRIGQLISPLIRMAYSVRRRGRGSMPWAHPDQYLKRSPISFARDFKTPTLVIGDGPEAAEMDFALQTRK